MVNGYLSWVQQLSRCGLTNLLAAVVTIAFCATLGAAAIWVLNQFEDPRGSGNRQPTPKHRSG